MKHFVYVFQLLLNLLSCIAKIFQTNTRIWASPFTFCAETSINTGGARGEEWSLTLHHSSPLFTLHFAGWTISSDYYGMISHETTFLSFVAEFIFSSLSFILLKLSFLLSNFELSIVWFRVWDRSDFEFEIRQAEIWIFVLLGRNFALS